MSLRPPARRSRSLIDMNGAYVGHAPAVVVDTKAAIRYLRYNDAAMPGTTDRFLITGTSGGGGLSVAISATGNSPDYYPYLYAIGAAGVTYDAASDTYASTLSDDVFGTVAYCPITDLDNADAAYEWMYNRPASCELGTYSADQMAASEWLKENYVPYFNKLGLRDENGKRMPADKLDEAITGHRREGNRGSVRRGRPDTDGRRHQRPPPTRTAVGTRSTRTAKRPLDLDKYLYFVVKNQALKTPPAFDNYKTTLQGQMNESNLAGTTAQEYSAFSEWAWNNNAVPGDGIGSEDTGLLWRDYIHTDAGEAVVKQMDMIDPMPYLGSDTERRQRSVLVLPPRDDRSRHILRGRSCHVLCRPECQRHPERELRARMAEASLGQLRRARGLRVGR